jgi:hypothetical protein
MKIALTLASVALLGLMAAAPIAGAQERLRPIGEVAFEPPPPAAQTGVFAIDRESRMVRSLRIEADGGTATIKEIMLVFRDGSERRVKIDQRIRDGEQTSAIRLQEPRPLREIEVVYQPSGPMRLILNADARPAEPPPPPPPQWVQIGCKNVGFLIDRDQLRVTTPDKFQAIRLSVKGYDVEMMEMGVTYGNGAQERYRVNALIPSGGRTNPISLRGEARSISKLDFLYRSNAISNVKTQLCVDGLKQSAPIDFDEEPE